MMRQLIHYEELDSTNLEAARRSKELAHGTVIVAESQTAGRGRRGRSWLSAKGENLYFSLLLKPDFLPAQAPMLTLVMALAVTEAVEQVCNCTCRIKWPNDIVLNGHKICGILTEMQPEKEKIHHVIIGVGVNVNQLIFDAEGLEYAGSIRKELGLPVDRAKLLEVILERFDRLYEQFCETGSLSGMRSAYQEKLANLHKEVRILDPQGVWQGTALGINDRGELIVRREDGTLETVYAGEVSVRGLWGYV